MTAHPRKEHNVRTIPQQQYLISILMREAERLAAGRESLVLPFFAVILRRTGFRIVPL